MKGELLYTWLNDVYIIFPPPHFFKYSTEIFWQECLIKIVCCLYMLLMSVFLEVLLHSPLCSYDVKCLCLCRMYNCSIC
jgi:hypothetical protein